MKFLIPLTALVSVCQAVTSNSSYTNSTSEDDEYSYSPPFYPTPQGGRIEDAKWLAAYDRARSLVDEMTVAEKVNLTHGVGMSGGPCSGNTGSVPRLNISSICVQDGPLGVRGTDLTTVFPAGLATASTFNKQLIYDRAVAIGAEFKAKGIDAALGPVYGPIGLKAQGGRGWEGAGPDAYLEGVSAYLQTIGIQSQGVISTAKHLVGNEQEHYRFPTAKSHGDIDYPHNTTESLSSEIDDRAMHELYLWPFAEAVRAGVGAVMCSYNRLNGSHASQNSYLLNYLLKEELGFQGFVMTDWYALYTGVGAVLAGLDMDMPGENAYFGGNLTVAALNSSVPLDRLNDMSTRILASLIYAGVHNPDGPNYNANTFATTGREYYSQDEGEIVVLNDHVNARSEFSKAISLKTATEAIVLLKNENNALPLTQKTTKRIAILGEAAGDLSEGTGHCALYGCVGGASGTGYGSGAGTYTYFITPANGIATRANEAGISSEYVRDSWNQEYSVDSASYADAAIVVANSLAGEEISSVEGNVGDLNNLTLWHNAESLIKNITSVNNNTILVITAGQQIDLENFIENENITAVIYSSYLGQDFGTAIARILFGDENPSGKLPFTFAKDTSDYIPVIRNVTVDEPTDRFNTSIFVDYKYFDANDIDVRYEFGYGLSYSNFSLSNLAIQAVERFAEDIEDDQVDYLDVYEFETPSLDPEDYVYPDGFTKITDYVYSFINDASEVENGTYPYPEGYSEEQLTKPASLAGGGLGGNPHLWDIGYIVTAKVTNEGPYDGSFAPQLYVGFPDSDEFPTPPVQLRGFDKVFLEDGYSKTVTFELTRKDLSVWDTTTQSWKVLRGDYKIYVASTSRELELVETITLE